MFFVIRIAGGADSLIGTPVGHPIEPVGMEIYLDAIRMTSS